MLQDARFGREARPEPPGYGPPPAPRQPGPPLDPPAPGGRSRPIRSHGRRRRRVPLWTIAVLVLGLVAVGAGLRFVPGSPFAPTGVAIGPGGGSPSVTPTPEPEPLPFRSADVTAAGMNTTGFLSWALMDRRTGEIVGSANMNASSETASMIKAWLASDFLRLADTDTNDATPSESSLKRLESMIRDSDNSAAEWTYNQVGRSKSIGRLISTCSLTDSKAPSSGFGWGYTKLSARDAVRMGDCIASGTAAGTKWTPWLLDIMRKVRGLGDFGIRKALPAAQQSQVAMKNGWDVWKEDGTYHTNCVAIGDTWIMAVMQRYPSQGKSDAELLAHTSKVCSDVATALLNPDVA